MLYFLLDLLLGIIIGIFLCMSFISYLNAYTNQKVEEILESKNYDNNNSD